MIKPVYLDYNGSTPLDPEVIEAMRPYLESEFGNPASSHWYGIGQKRAIETARDQVAGLIGCSPEEVFFTSGGTESNNQALKSIGGSLFPEKNHIITSQIEHPAVLEVCRYLESHGHATTYLPVDQSGLVDPSDLTDAITPETAIISIMHANNEVGTIQPVEKIAALAKKHGILMHTDAAQTLGKIETRLDRLNVDLLSIAGHKLYAPKGVGALFIRKGIDRKVFCHGAGQESGVRAGTENVMGIVGLGKACEIAARNLDRNTAHLKAMRDRLETNLLSELPDIKINGHLEKRLPNTSSISFLNLEANRIIERIGHEVAVSAGAACHSNSIRISHVLAAMGIDKKWAMGTLRFTTGKMTTAEQIDRASGAVVSAVKKMWT